MRVSHREVPQIYDSESVNFSSYIRIGTVDILVISVLHFHTCKIQ